MQYFGQKYLLYPCLKGKPVPISQSPSSEYPAGHCDFGRAQCQSQADCEEQTEEIHQAGYDVRHCESPV